MQLSQFLEGERIYLRGLIPSDAAGKYVAWFNDEEVCRHNSHHVFPYSLTDCLDYIAQSQSSRTSLALAIIKGETDAHIGNVSLENIDWVARSASLSIIIGDKSSWGKGYGLEACRLVCHHGFLAMNLHRIHAGTYAGNAAFIALARSVGMTKEGVRRQAAWKNGQYVDVIEFGILREEFLRREIAEAK